LAEIWAYLAEEASETIATRFVASIEAKFAPLLQSPLIGSPRDQFAAGLRAIFKTPYVIYYVPTARELIIVRVLHSARDATAIADQGGFVV
jgi:toxin ParE1/3/4